MGNPSTVHLPLPDAKFRVQLDQRVSPILRMRRRRRTRLRLAIAATAFVVIVSAAIVLKPDLLYQIPSTGYHIDQLSAMDTESLLRLREQLARTQAAVASFEFVPISAVVGRSDCIVEAVVATIEYDRQTLIEQIAAGQLGALHATVTLDVTNSYPPIPETKLSVPGTIGHGLGFAVGSRYLIPLEIRNGEYAHPYSFGMPSDYPIREIDGEYAVIELLVAIDGPMALADAWQLIRSLFDAKTGKQSAQDVLERLKYRDFHDARVALEILMASVPRLYSDADLLDTLEAHHTRIMAPNPGSVGDYGPEWRLPSEDKWHFQDVARTILDLLYPIATEPVVERLLRLYLADRTDPSAQAFENDEIETRIVHLALKHPGPERRGRVRSVLGRRIMFKGKHGQYGHTVIGRPDYFTLRLIAETPGDDMAALLADILQHPDEYEIHPNDHTVSEAARADYARVRAETELLRSTSQLAPVPDLAELYRHGRSDVLLAVALRATVADLPDIIFTPAIDNVPQSEWLAAAVAERHADPELLPVLRELAQNGGDLGRLLPAMARCGASDEARTIALEAITAEYPGERHEIYSDSHRRQGALLALGVIGSNDAIEIVREWMTTQADSYADAEIALREGDEFFLSGNSSALRIRLAAALAMTRLNPPEALEYWRSEWEQGSAQSRMSAAMALHYLGDDTGRDYLESFVYRSEETIPELRQHRRIHGPSDEFQRVIAHLRSPQLDDLFLERIDNGVSNNDRTLLGDIAFELEHAPTVVQKLLRLLEFHDAESRKIANEFLTKIIGAEVDWDDEALAGTQPEKLATWHRLADAFIQSFTPIVTPNPAS